MPYLLMLVSITLTLMQGHSGSANANQKNQRGMLSETKQAISITVATTVGHFYVTLILQTFIGLDHLVLFF